MRIDGIDYEHRVPRHKFESAFAEYLYTLTEDESDTLGGYAWVGRYGRRILCEDSQGSVSYHPFPDVASAQAFYAEHTQGWHEDEDDCEECDDEPAFYVCEYCAHYAVNGDLSMLDGDYATRHGQDCADFRRDAIVTGWEHVDDPHHVDMDGGGLSANGTLSKCYVCDFLYEEDADGNRTRFPAYPS